jgi:membrane protease subunit HflK
MIVVAVVVVIWLLTGIYSVDPGEKGVVRRFGKESSQTNPGLNWHWPWPIEKVTKVNMEEIRITQIGFRETAPGVFQDVPAEELMLTQDENVASIHLIVQYKVKVGEASNFLFKVVEVETALKAASEVALRGIVGQNPIDYVLVEGRADVEARVQTFLQELLDSYEAGLTVTKVNLQEADAPEEVRDAFQEVVRAREDKSRLIREAEGYAADLVPKAMGEKEKTILDAEAYREQRILRAEGDASKFTQVLEEYLKSPEVTRQRLYLETIERVMPGLEKIVIDSQSAGNLLQFLPLKELTTSQPAAGGGGE